MKKVLFLLLPLVLWISACQPDQPDDPAVPSAACSLESFQFLGSANPGMAAAANATFATIMNRDILLVTVPENVDITHLVPSFKASDKATVRIDGSEIISNSTPVNFSGEVQLDITAENGNAHRSYSVLVRKGNAEIDKKVYDIMVKYQIPGIGLATTKKEIATYSAGYGYASIDTNPRVLVRPDMLFRLASMSKAQTALCIMTLCEEGRLSVDDYVFRPKEGVLAAMYPGQHGQNVDDIKIRHLLSHTSGWAYATTGGVDPVFTSDSRFAGKSLKDRVAYMVGTATSNYPGTSFSYYNLGFCILGQVIEQITGVSYETYLRSVVAKAGVKDMWVAKTHVGDRRANECIYYPQGSSTAYGNDMDVVGACGAVIASPLELMQLLSAQDYGDVVPDILTKESLDAMYTNYHPTVTVGGYGFGWRINHSLGWYSYHGGNLSGTATIWARGKNGVNGVLLCNSRSQTDGFDSALYVALNDIMNLVNQAY